MPNPRAEISGETNERYQRLVEMSPDGIFISQRARILLVNTAAVRLVAESEPAQLLDRSQIDIFHPENRATVEEWMERLVVGRTAPRIEARVMRRDGTVAHVEVTGTLLEESPDRLIQIIVHDVTERKRKEAELRENNERLTLAFAGAREGVWDWNLETGAVVYSPRWKEMLGYSEEEIEPHVSAWERLLHPDDKPRAERLNDGVQHGGPYEGEFRLRHKNGHYIFVLSRGFPVRPEPGGRVVRIVGTHLDITDRKEAEAALRESEERLTLAFAGAQEGVWDWNLETGAVVYSTRWKQMLGYADDEIEPHLSAWERLLHPDDFLRAQQLNEHVHRGAGTYEGEFRLRHKDGHYVHVLSRGYPVRREPGGPVVRIVGTHFDLTERKRAEAERARTEFLGRLVFAQEDERRRIARDMHDRFGEHLTALVHRIGVLKEGCASDAGLCAQVDALESVAQQLDRDVDRLVWELRPTALDDLGLRAALSNHVKDWSKVVGIAANVYTSGLLDERLSPDVETTLYRIAQEALTNVARHARAGNVEVILERRPDHVLLIVEDDGVGFDVDREAAGQGFGLQGMHERATLVGGSLQIESAAGKGTTIFVRMPAEAGLQVSDRV
jgi:PAS domain S-box-containing protein